MTDSDLEQFLREHTALSKKLRKFEVAQPAPRDADGNIIYLPHVPLELFDFVDQGLATLEEVKQDYGTHLNTCKTCTTIYNNRKGENS